MKKILFLCIFSFLSLFLPAISYADSNFQTSFTGTYYVNDSGVTHGVFSVSLKNLSDKFYATSYTLELGFENISNVVASDQDGPIAASVKKTGTGEEITFPFNHHAIGLGAVQPFTFSFDTTSVATKNGSIWEVNIPGLQSTSDFGDFSVRVSVPSDFGQPVYMKPNVGGSLTFTKDQLGKSGISIAFGSKQAFHFDLAYHLKNTQVFPAKTEIALPPDTTYQQISLDSITPKPLNVMQDPDGNWLAQFSLLPSQTLTVHVDGRAFLSLNPTKQPLSDTEKKLYLQPSTYWQTKNASIQQLAQQLKTPYAIYEYVVKTLHYDFSRVSDNQQRLGAVAVLANPQSAVCLEFTDLFIAIARAAGIPAREIDGYAYTQNSRQRPLSLQKDILHAWPEYYDDTSGTWVMVDPTWENTTGGVDYFHTFDFDHIAFVIKGQNPDYPIPAGGYKLPGEEADQDIIVNFSDNTTIPDPTSSLDFSLPKQLIAGFPVSTQVVLSNTSSVAFPDQQLSFSSSITDFSPKKVDVGTIPPYGTTTIDLLFGKTPFLTNKQGTVTILFAGTSITKVVSVVPFSITVGILGGGIFIGLCTIIIFIIARKARNI